RAGRAATPAARAKMLSPPDDQGIALATTTTKGCRARMQASALQLMGEREHEAGAAGADRMADGDRAAIDVDTLLVELEHACCIQGDRGKSLVDLYKVDDAGR